MRKIAIVIATPDSLTAIDIAFLQDMADEMRVHLDEPFTPWKPTKMSVEPLEVQLAPAAPPLFAGESCDYVSLVMFRSVAGLQVAVVPGRDAFEEVAGGRVPLAIPGTAVSLF